MFGTKDLEEEFKFLVKKLQELFSRIIGLEQREHGMNHRINSTEHEIELLRKEIHGIADKLGLVWIPAKCETKFDDAH